MWWLYYPCDCCSLVVPNHLLSCCRCSYAHVNWDYRQARRKGIIRPGERGSHEIPEAIDAEPMQYPENITLGNLGYFIVAPTLCYQPVYPRNTRFRIKWLLR